MPIKSRVSTTHASRDQGVLFGMTTLEPRKRTKQPNQQPEFREQVTLFYWLNHFAKREAALAWIHSVPNGLPLTPKVANDAEASGLTEGIWDVFVPCCRDGAPGLYLEMKWGTNDLSEKQKRFGAHIAGEGYRRVVCWCWVDAFEAIVTYLGVTNPEIERVIAQNRCRYPRARRPRWDEATAA